MSGNVNLHFAMSLVATMKAMSRVDCIFLSNVGSSLLHMARNTLVAQALAEKADKIVFVDDDVSWTNGGFERLILAPEHIVAGVYQKKPHNPHASPEMAVSINPEGLLPNHNGLCEVDGAATGFLRIDAEVFEALKPHCPKIHDDGLKPHEVEHLFEFFSFGKMIKDGRVYVHGEDYAFCYKARDAGFKTYIEPTILLGHHHGNFKFDAALKTIDLL
jgi:hypothetical protein